ncbi:MAG TPA: type III-A CRISPR-associated protein Cas10/Csm1 [Clostridia bacterium]
MKKEIAVASLLHDVGKVVYRSGKNTNHSELGVKFLKEVNSRTKTIFDANIINAVNFHHWEHLINAKIKEDDISYIICEADNIAAGIDRKNDKDNKINSPFYRKTPLQSIFCLINEKTEPKYYSNVSDNLIQDFILPSEKNDLSSQHYGKIADKLKNELININNFYDEPGYLNTLLELIKSNLYYVPSSTRTNQICDISLFLHSKLTACIATSMYDYLSYNNRNNYKYEIFKHNYKFRNEKAFLMASVDISGIQKFIYTITTASAQKQLRARSIYIELVMENLIDEILNELGYSRCNLLYSGGGHFYLLIGNTPQIKTKFEDIIKKQNEWFIDNMGIALYVAGALTECSGKELMSKTLKDKKNYKNIFRSLSKELSIKKLKRYDFDQIEKLNDSAKEHTRECRVCGLPSKTDKDICDICNSLIDFGSEFLKKDIVFVFTKDQTDQRRTLKMFSYKNKNYYFQTCPRDQITREEINNLPSQNIVRLYSKNSFEVGYNKEVTIFMGDYNIKGYTFDEYANKSIGIERLGVLRADVDDLGKTFINGFDIEIKENYSTISRATAFSESLSMFFKYFINRISDNHNYKKVSLTNTIQDSPRNISIVYSGGDDLFIVGSWNEVLEFAIDFYKLFRQYTCEKLTLSAGFGIYPKSYPFSAIAAETGELENYAKMSGKNCIALFDKNPNNVFKWDELEDKVINEKLHFLLSHYNNKISENGSSNMSQVYNLLNYIRNIEYDKINLARLAYALARIQNDMDTEQKNDREFIDKIYEWSKNGIDSKTGLNNYQNNDRKQLIAALTLYIYLKREKENE